MNIPGIGLIPKRTSLWAVALLVLWGCGPQEEVPQVPEVPLSVVKQALACNPVNPPQYRGAPVEMNTFSHGGGYSPAFEEFWYPAWSGRTVHRYSKDHRYLGTFTTGRDHIMQLAGDDDGDYYTAHWDRQNVSRWEGRTDNEVWTTDLPTTVGGVAVGEEFIWAMAHQDPTLWKLDKDSGELLETITAPAMVGTLYGGLAIVGDVLYAGRNSGRVYRISLNDFQVIDTFETDINIYNMSFDGKSYCVSPNSSSVFCYEICNDPLEPRGVSQQVSTTVNRSVNITLQGEDDNDRDLTYTLLSPPEHGSLIGEAPNLIYSPIAQFVGFDSLTFKVNNGIQDSPPVRVTITVLPQVEEQPPCDVVDPPRYRGGLVTMNTHSHGGGYSPAYEEYWYPQWSGTTINRYDKNRQFIGTFNAGRNQIMQLTGLSDGSYLTAHWGLRRVSRWQGLSSNVIWTAELPGIIGGVASDEEFAYAMDYRAPTVWKLALDNGEVVDQFDLPSMEGTLYGGLSIIDGVLYAARHTGRVYKIDLDTQQVLGDVTLDSNIFNMAFDGNDICVSANTDSLYCYTVCDDETRPRATGQQVSTPLETPVNITLQGTDPDNLPLEYIIVNRPEHGSLTGDMPNLTYEPIDDFVGFDRFTFKVSNGEKESPGVDINIAVLPEVEPLGECDVVNPPQFRGGLVDMNTRSHGGGYSPAFEEYWYPAWSGTTVYRYDRDHQFIGTFRTGRDQVMQLTGLRDGSYLTANWSRRKVSRWQALSSNLLWTLDVDGIVGGVAADDQFAYAMDYRSPLVWKINLATGELVEEFAVPLMEGTLYGGLAIIDGVLYAGRHTGRVYRINLETRELIDDFTVDTNIYNMSFDDKDMCVSPNSSTMFCYTVCNDDTRPAALSQQVTTPVNETVNITLAGSDPENRDLTFEVVTRPRHGSLTGEAPNLTYEPIGDFVGFDSFTFKVNNGIRDSSSVRINITILPDVEPPGNCDVVNPPVYRGGTVTMNTVSHGGGFSAPFGEYWYPAWSGTTVYRYDRDHQFIGTFRTGRDQVMQLWGGNDGTYLTAHWNRRKVSRWQALSANLIWSFDTDDVVGGVTEDDNFVYAMAHQEPVLWVLNPTTGQLIEKRTLPEMEGTLYGGLIALDGVLYVGRHTGRVYRIDLDSSEIIDEFTVDTRIYNMSFDGNEMCVSPNNDRLFCYNICADELRPTALSQQLSTQVNNNLDVTLTGNDPNNRNLSYFVLEQPEHGSLVGEAPNLRYEPILDFTGFDSFTFKVSNGQQDSPAVTINITVLPDLPDRGDCEVVANPEFRGGTVTMNTRSYGGGYSPAFGEYWYPAWSGTTVYRYNSDYEFIGTFRTGIDHVMQLWGEADGTYLTATWDRKKIARWQGLNDNLIWSTEVEEVVGGVTSDDAFVYAMAHSAPIVWKLNRQDGSIVEQINVPAMSGTLYGGLALVNGRLYVGRDSGLVHIIDLDSREIVDEFATTTTIRNMSFDGNDYCVSPNTSQMSCYTLCEDANRPTAVGQQLSTLEGISLDITLEGSDNLDRDLLFQIVQRPEHGSLTGEAPNLVYEPIDGFVGLDTFTFRVNNGLNNSAAVAVTIAVLPVVEQPGACETVDPPRFRGAPVTMNTRSHGGGYSPAYEEYWYPNWSGTQVYRYDRNHRFLGTFNSGRDQIMQLQGLRDGTYVTANWGRRTVARWQGLGADQIWSFSADDTVGGVAVDGDVVYAMPSGAAKIWKISLDDGELIETVTLTGMPGTLYGGLAIANDILYVGRSDGKVHRFNLETNEKIDDFTVDSNIHNMAFDGNDICVSPNTDQVFCYNVCNDTTRPEADSQQLSTLVNNGINIELTGTDADNRDLTFEIVEQPARGSSGGNIPNVVYNPETGFVGIDRFSFKVNNGIKDSYVATISVTVQPNGDIDLACDRVNPPRFRGAPVTMDTRSYGGGYSLVFGEYWYPHWSSSTIYRYDKDLRPVGVFNSGRGSIMQLWGDTQTSDYYTAHWSSEVVSRWQGLSANVRWTTDLDNVIGGVTSDDEFVYALAHQDNTMWRLDKDTGEVLQTISIPIPNGTTYGSFALIDGIFYIGRSGGQVYRLSKDNNQLIDEFRVDTDIRNMSFDGNDLCFSPNTDQMFCFNVCRDVTRPTATSQQVDTTVNTGVNITLEGTDPQDRNLTFTVVDVPEHGELTGDAPNLRYEPINDFVGFDAFTFKVNNGLKNSVPVTVTITVLPDVNQPDCELVNPPQYRGAPVTMDTRSYGGGYSPAFEEYWYPQWSGRTIYRYNKDREFVGTFNSGRGSIMQLWADDDGSYYTAHWSLRQVSRWQGLSANLTWTLEVDDTVGGVTADENFVYAVAHQNNTVWKINKSTGALVEQFTVPTGTGTTYGAVALIEGILYVGRDSGQIYRINLAERTLIDSFNADTPIRNMAFDDNDICVSPNSSQVYCYNVCRNDDLPTALGRQVSVNSGDSLDITLSGTDPLDRELTFELIDRPAHGSLEGSPPLLRYTPVNSFVGVDSFSFKVNNGVQDSVPVTVTITVLPDNPPQAECDRLDEPVYRGAPVTMNTRSHGGGFSPAFNEFWYPAWGGTTVYRYSKDGEQIGTFRSGRGSMMQLWGLADGSYLTGHWSLRQISRWQALSANAIWTTDVDDVVGGVTSDGEFVYAIAHQAPKVWRLDINSGEVLEPITVPPMSGTIYGGLTLVDGILHVGRNDGVVHQIDLESREIVSTFPVATSVFNASFDGQDYCISPNSDSLYCYRLCNDPDQPSAGGVRVTTPANTTVNITLEGSDPQGRDLTYTLLTRPARGTLTGEAPNLTYEPILDFTGFDTFTYKVNNGIKDSPAVRVTITVLPEVEEPGDCVEVNPPQYRGSPALMNTRSYGGGYSPAFEEYWYPQWSGRTVYRYSKDHQFLGTFSSGRSLIMQLWGQPDGSYLTAHWSAKNVSRWEGQSANAIWSTDVDGIVGGVTADNQFAYAMEYQGTRIWKLDVNSGEVLEELEAPEMPGTLYGGLALRDDVLYIGRDNGVVYRVNVETMELVDTFAVATSINNSSFNGTEYCVSPNSSSLYCYSICGDSERPTATGQQVVTRSNETVDITLTGSDPENRDLTFEVLTLPEHGSLTGDAPNLTYEPINEFVGIDKFSFKVNNGIKDSAPVTVNIAITPQSGPPVNCQPLDEPRYRGAPVEMNTRSHGGGYSPAFGEYWYPHWSGGTIYRYDRDRKQVGIFRTGRGAVMQLTGDIDGAYYTAHWSGGQVSKWQALTADAIWTTDLQATVGGVAVTEDFVYAMDYREPIVWKLRKDNGAVVDEFEVDGLPVETLYGGLLIFNDKLYVGKAGGTVYIVNLETESVESSFAVASNIYNMSFDGQDMCVSPNSDTVYCYTLCEDPEQPRANSQQLSTTVNEAVSITLTGEDPNNRDLSFEIIRRPDHGSLLGTAPNLSYEPILDFVGVDSFTFKVNNGVQDSPPVTVNISILPDVEPVPSCTLYNVNDEPAYRGRPADMNTRSYGGGYSPAFREYWYPNWSGTTITRYNDNRQFEGIFLTGRSSVMQLWGEEDGTYFTAHWSNRIVARWQGLGANLIWSTDLQTTVGGVTADDNFVYAMAHSGTRTWKLNKSDGSIVEEFNVPAMSGTLYGGLAMLDGDLLVGRDNRVVYRIDLETNQIVDSFTVASRVYNMSFNGSDICVSENSSAVHCYAVCGDAFNRPPFIDDLRDQAHSEGDNINLPIDAFDEDNDIMTFSATGLPPGLSIAEDTGIVTGTISIGAQENSPYNVTIGVSDGLSSYETSFSWTIYDPSLQPPVIISRDPQNGWTNGPFQVVARINDDCEEQPITFIQGRNLTTSSALHPESGWVITTGIVSGEQLHEFGLRLRSFCSNKGAVENIVIGIDTEAPTLNFTAGENQLDQEEIDLEDPETWPSLNGLGRLPMFGLLRDEASGVGRASATVVPVAIVDGAPEAQEDDAVTIHDQTFGPQVNNPPTGPLSQVVAFCSNEDHCNANNLDIGSLPRAAYYELRLSVTDFAGNTFTVPYRFKVIDLLRAIELWRQTVIDYTSDNGQANTFLGEAVDKLDLAILGLRQERYGNMILGLEDAGGLIAQAQIFDGDISFKTEALLVADLASDFFGREVDLGREEFGDRSAFDTADDFIGRARSNIALEEEGSARTAFLELANSYFWLEEGRNPTLVNNYADAVRVMDDILGSMDDYIANDPVLPGVDAKGIARNALAGVRTYLLQVAVSGPNSATDLEHVQALMTMTNAAESIKEAEESTAWVRQYQWGLTQIVYIFVERGLNSAISFMGPENPIILEGQTALERADEFRLAFRADDFMDLLINSRCMILGIYNLAFDPDEEVPNVCCDLMVEYNGLDDRVPVPNNCQ